MQQSYKLFLMLLLLGILIISGAWYGHLDDTRYTIDEVRHYITADEAKAALDDYEEGKDYFYEQSTTTKITRKMIPFIYKYEIIQESPKSYYSK